MSIRRKADKRRTYFDLLPGRVLRLIATHLTPTDVLDTLLLIRPSLFEDLRNGVAWSEVHDFNRLEHARHVMLASVDAVKVLGIDHCPVGRHLASKWQRVAMGKQLRTIVVENVDRVKGRRISPSVKELRLEVATASGGSAEWVLEKMFKENQWEEFQPSAPAPKIESVSVFNQLRKGMDFSDFGERYVSLHRGDLFFRAFPEASKLALGHQPTTRFFDQPASVLVNVRELSVFYNVTCPETFDLDNTVFVYLARLKNLEVLELRGDAMGNQLELLQQAHVHESLRTLRIFDVLHPFYDRSPVWVQISRQFPRLKVLHIEREPHWYTPVTIDRRCSLSRVLKEFKHLESVTLNGYIVPLDVAIELCSHPSIQSVVCHSVFAVEFALTEDVSLKISRLMSEVPGCRVDFHLANEWNGTYSGGFRFVFSRS